MGKIMPGKSGARVVKPVSLPPKDKGVMGKVDMSGYGQ